MEDLATQGPEGVRIKVLRADSQTSLAASAEGLTQEDVAGWSRVEAFLSDLTPGQYSCGAQADVTAKNRGASAIQDGSTGDAGRDTSSGLAQRVAAADGDVWELGPSDVERWRKVDAQGALTEPPK